MTDPLDEPTGLMAYDREGNRIGTLREYVEVFNGDRMVARSEDVGEEKVTVSTVFLVFDHGHSAIFGGAPLLFETMVFGGEHGQAFTRYSTEAEARSGHEQTVNCVEAGIDPFNWEGDEDDD